MKSELSKIIKAFEEKSDFYNVRLTKCEQVHALFLERWPRERLHELLTLDSYAIGTGDQDTFCYWVERKTRMLGSILGATAKKFKVYYDHDQQDYKYVAPFRSARAAFDATKAAILDLLNAADRDDMDAIKGNGIFSHSHLFRGKVLHLYFPEKFICIFSEDDIDYFLDRMGVDCHPSEHVLDKNQKLLRYKNESAEFSNWSSRSFMYFLYDQFVPPSHARTSGESAPSQSDAELRKQEGHFVLPRIRDVHIETVAFGDISAPFIRRSGKVKKFNYIAEAVRNTKLGNHGEDLVVAYEKHTLEAAGRTDLASRVKRVSVENDALGYDVLSFDLNGEERLIEVKSSTGGIDANMPFFLSENERVKMTESNSRYFIYRLMAANTRRPRLLVIGAAEFSERCRMNAKVWQVSVVGQNPSDGQS